MPKFSVVKSETSVILTVFILDSSQTDGRGLGSLDQTSSIVGGYVKRGGTGVALAVDENVTTEGTYEAPSAAAKVRIGTPANMTTGTYELHFHNDLFTTADWVTITLSGAANMAPLLIEVQLTDFNLNSATPDVNIKTITAGIIANASFNADVGSTGHATNIIALAVTKILEELNLDHLLKVTTGVAADSDLEAYVVAGTVMAHIMAAAADATAYKASTDSLQGIRDRGDAAWITATSGGSPLVLGAGYIGDFEDNETIEFTWNTVDRSGAAVAPSTAGTIKVYKSTGTTEVQSPDGVTDTRTFSGTVGNHQCVIDLSLSAEYVKGENYSVVLEGAVIDTKTANVSIATFSIKKRYQGQEFRKE